MAGALAGMRVLDMSQYEAGPSCAQYLGWLGADVVKVEALGGEPGRRLFHSDRGTDGQYFLNYNANKRSVALDLKSPRGRELFTRLVPRFDVLVENQGPGVMERLGLGYEELSALNPGLIYARIKGYGLSGPYADYKSFDQLAQAAAGLFSLTGDADGPPMRPGGTFADTGTGVHTALAICAAYVHQQATGEGQLIEIAMHEVMTMFIRTTAAAHWGPDAAPAPRASRSDQAPAGLYATKGGGPNDHVYLVVANRDMWETFCKVIDRADLLTDERFASWAGRRDNAEALRAEIGRWFALRTKTEAMAHLGDAGIPCSATFATDEVFNDPHLRARGFVQTVSHPARGEVMVLGSPLRLSRSEVALQAAPTLGQHTEEVLAAELALSSDQLAGLRAEGVIG